MKRSFCLALLCFACHAAAQLPAPKASEIKYPRQPSLSPDGKRVAFSWQGDIWSVPVEGGTASRITIHEAHDQYPAWSPDGRWIAFSSKRDGGYDVWIIPATGGSARQLTFHPADDLVNGWSPDGSKILFSSNRETNRTVALYTVDVRSGATRLAVEDIVPANHGAFSPDGREIYYTRGGSWPRKGYRGSGQSDLLAVPAAGGPGRYMVKTPENERWPMPASSKGALYYVSDRDGTANLYSKASDAGGAAAITHFKEGNIFFPSFNPKADRIVFEHDFQLWSADVRGASAPCAISILAPTDAKSNPVRRETFTSGVQEAQLSPDGKSIGYVVHGEVFMMPSGGGEAVRLTKTPAREQQLAWSPDSARIAFTSDRGGEGDIYSVDVKSKETTQLTKTPGISETTPVYSPDGKQIAYVRGLNGQELVVASSKGGAEKVISHSPTISSPAWSPDGKWIAFTRSRSHSAGSLSNIYVVSSEGGSEINVTRYPVNNGDPTWTPDGTRLLFSSNRTTQTQVWSVILRDERKDPDPEGPKPAAKGPVQVKIDPEEIHLRAKQITRADSGVTGFTVTPDSRGIIFAVPESGRPDLWRVGIDGGVSSRLTQSGEAGADIHFGPDASRAIYRSSGSIKSLAFAGPAPAVSAVPFSARMDVDVRAEMLQMFDEAWRKMRDGFYDEKMHGCDWNGLRTRYRPVVEDLTHKEDFYALFNLALGELNASHTGIAASAGPAQPGGQSYGMLGVVYDDAYAGPGVRVKSVLAHGPADREKSRLKPGDILFKVDGETIPSNEKVYNLLQDRVGKTVELTVNDKPEETGARTVKIEPITMTAQKRLDYEKWSKEREQQTEKLSNGRLGYIHLDQMGPEQLERFRRAALGDLEDKEGVVLDVRFNGGGSIADEMFAILQARVFGYRTIRGEPTKLPAPMPAFTRPVIVLINESSFSNAEVFPWGFKGLRLGKVVGVPTYGGVIGTGGTDLIDGSSLRMPAVGSYTLDGQNMENNGCPPDILVEVSPEDVYHKADPQLARAVEELLKQIGSMKN